jgi:tetratricopeptide (TPR) repeat protein
VLLAGEPGVGKTRLATEIARRVHDDDGHVLAGRCDEELGVAYLPFVEAFRHCCDHVPVGALPYVLGRLPGELRRLWPELGEVLPGLATALDADTETQRYRLFDAVASWLSALSSTRPVLLVLDDLHWATPTTIQLLRHLLRAPDDLHVLIVATYRDVELGRTHPLAEALADLRRMPNVTRIAVDGLSSDEVERFVEAAAGHDLDARAVELARAVHRRTSGNPLFIGETLLHLVESGRVYLDGDRWRYDADPDHLGVPEGLREVIGRRLSRLGDDANEILRMASVVGLEFDERVVGAAAGRTEDDVAAALAAALGAGIIAEGGPLRYRFTHAVLRDTLYDELRSSPRIRAHLAVARAIESVHAGRLDPHLADLAHHYGVAAPAGHSGAAIERAVAAARQAEAGGAHEQAAHFYELGLDALEWDPDAGTEADLLIAKGTALWRANAVDAARAGFERAAAVARRLRDPERFARAALGAGGGSVRAWWLEWGRIQQWLIDLLEEALAGLPAQDSPLRAQVLAMLARELAFTSDTVLRRRALGEEAEQIARRLGDPVTLARVRCAVFMGLCDVMAPEERVECGEEVVSLARDAGDLELEIQGHYEIMYGALERGDRDRVDAEVDTSVAIAETLAQPFWRWLATAYQSMVLLLDARWDEAVPYVRRANELADEAGEVTGHQVFTVQMNVIALLRGRAAEGSPEETYRAVSTRYGTTSVFVGMSYGSFARGDAEGALASLEADSRNDFASTPDDALAGYMFAFLAWMVYCLDAAAYAPAVYDRLLALQGRFVLPCGPFATFSPADTYLGMLAIMMERLDDAEAHLDRAAELLAKMRAPWLSLFHLAALADLARARGDAELASELVAQGLNVADGLQDRSIRYLLERTRRRLEGETVPEPVFLNAGLDRSASPSRPSLRRRFRAAVDERARSVMQRWIAGTDDEKLEARFGSPRAQRRIFEGMVRAYRPDLRYGFVGEIAYELSRHGTTGGLPDIDHWTLTVDDSGPTLRQGPPRDPAVVFRCPVPLFVRMAAGDIDAIVAVYERKVRIDGDLLLAARAAELFGGTAAIDTIDAVQT